MNENENYSVNSNINPEHKWIHRYNAVSYTHLDVYKRQRVVYLQRFMF